MIIGGLLAAGTVLGQKLVDDRRAERELHAALSANRHDLQMENLRFIRERSWDTPTTHGASPTSMWPARTWSACGRPDRTSPRRSQRGEPVRDDLSRSNFARANLHDANLTRAILRGAYFRPDASRTPRTDSVPI